MGGQQNPPIFMPNKRRDGLVHIGAWVDNSLAEDLMLVAHFQVADMAKIIVAILRKELKRELKRIPVGLRSRVRTILREKRKNHTKTHRPHALLKLVA